jgi:hypothetical protein
LESQDAVAWNSLEPKHPNTLDLAKGIMVTMPLTVFDSKGISATRRERIQGAVEAGGKEVSRPYEAWIAADSFRKMVRVLITGPQGFERSVLFPVDEDTAVIREMVRQTLDE